MFNKFLPPLTL